MGLLVATENWAYSPNDNGGHKYEAWESWETTRDPLAQLQVATKPPESPSGYFCRLGVF